MTDSPTAYVFRIGKVVSQIKYRCLFSSVPVVLPTFDPRDVTAEVITKVHGCFVDRQLVNGCPEFQLIALAVTLVAVVSPGGQVH